LSQLLSSTAVVGLGEGLRQDKFLSDVTVAELMVSLFVIETIGLVVESMSPLEDDDKDSGSDIDKSSSDPLLLFRFRGTFWKGLNSKGNSSKNN